jgi:hypothetical protein
MMNMVHYKNIFVNSYSSLYTILIFDKNIPYYVKKFNKFEKNIKKVKK